MSLLLIRPENSTKLMLHMCILGRVTVTEMELFPAANGLPGTGVSAPVVLTVASGVIPALGAARLPVVQALRRVE